jgi:DNA-binding NtrC family response regulator
VASHSVPRVFVVDDEHLIAGSLAAILNMHGYSATSFTSPLEALAAAQSRVPDLLITDVAMPGLSGVDLAILIKAECPECKILLFSGHATNHDLLKDARGQVNTFQLLQKPVHPSVMLSNVRSLTMKRRLPGRKSPNPVTASPVKSLPRILQMRSTGAR